MSVLSSQDRQCWEENGYVIVHQAVPQSNLDAAIRAIAEFLEIDPDEPDSLYRDPPRRLGFVEMYHHQALWNNRQSTRVHQAFAEIWGTECLWVSIDRANLTPPERPDRPRDVHEPLIHWDLDTAQEPVPFRVQGVLYLTDTGENQGGFRCVPGFHRRFDAWVKTQPNDRDPWHPDLTGLEVTKIPGRAGDLVIWHSLLPHGNSHNTSDRSRLAQYITMVPAEERNEALRQKRIQMWRERLVPDGFPGDPRQRERRDGTPAALTGLGKKLLGLEPWHA